jgi:hypothetical protein
MFKRNYFQKISITDYLALTVIIISILVTYSSAIFIPFGMPDDYAHAARYLQSGSPQNLLSSGPREGRIFQGLLLFLAYRPTKISDFAHYRLISIGGFILLTILIYSVLRRHEKEIVALFFALSCIFLLPFLSWLAWGVLLFVPYAACIGGLAAIITYHGFTVEILKYKVLVWFSGVCLFWIALNIYQPAAMFYWVFSGILLLADNPGFVSQLKKSIIIIGLGCASLAFAFTTMKIVQSITGYSAERTSLTTDIIEKLRWFVLEPLQTTLNFYALVPLKYLPFLTGGIILIGLFLYFHGDVIRKLLSLLLILVFVILSYIPNLVIIENWGSYRTLAGVSVLLLFFLFTAIKTLLQLLAKAEIRFLNLEKLGIWALGLVFIFSLLTAHYRMLHYFALPAYIEHRFLKNELIKGLREETKRIILIRANWGDSVAKTLRYDEFGIQSAFTPWASSSLVKVILEEIDPGLMDIPIKFFNPEQFLQERYGDLIIDMRQLRDFQY